MRGWRAALKFGAPLLIFCACPARSLERNPDGGGPGSIEGANGGGANSGGSAPRPGGPVTGSASVGTGPGGAPGTASSTCPAGSDVPYGESPVQTPAVPVATRPPFSCAPLPEAFIFPPPAPEAPGLYSRCASFSVGRASAVAVSPDGQLAALATGDGIARVVELASRQVVTVLASPRAMIDAVAFGPDGRSILTMARAQREVTLWQASDWAPAARVWTVVLPGHRYDRMFGGGLGFAPDGRTAVASPGTGVFVLDVASGALRASAHPLAAVLDVSYGLAGSRIVVAQASLLAHCVPTPNGGVVTLFDETLRAIAELADYGTAPGWRGIPAFRAAPAADLVLLAPRAEDPPGLLAFRLSDGVPLPPPRVSGDPLAFMPDGETALMYAGGVIRRARIEDGSVAAAVTVGDSGPVGVSADGGVVALAGAGNDLLRTWKVGDDAVSAVCAAEAPADGATASSLSADGQLLAFTLGSSVRVVRRADGGMVMKLPANPARPHARVDLSPRGRYAAIAPNWNATEGAAVVRLPAGGTVATFAPEMSGWLDFLFTPSEDRVYSIGKRSSDYTLDSVDLASPSKTTSAVVPPYTTLLGFSLGCPVLYSHARGAWRSCGGCEDAPVGGGGPNSDVFGPSNAVLSSDGMFVAIAGPYQGPGVMLWRLGPDPAPLLTIGQRAEDAAFAPQEFPIAITYGAARILTGAAHVESCYGGPDFEVYVRDNFASRQIADTLPPGVTAVDAAARTVAYGAQLWCSR